MKIARNITSRLVPVALPGRSIHLAGGQEAPLSDLEADEGPVHGLIKSRAIKVRDASPADKAAFPAFDETPNKEFVAVQRRRKQLASARVRAAGGNA